MKIRDPKSIIIILVYAAVCCGIIGLSFLKRAQEINTSNKAQALAPEYTYIENLDYFHLKNGVPLMSLSATRMKSLGEETAEFEDPKGVYNYQQKNKSLRYQALEALYRKD